MGFFGRAGAAGAEWLTSLLDWTKRKPLTIAGAEKTNAVFGTDADQQIETFATYTDQTDAQASWVANDDSDTHRVDVTNDLLDCHAVSDLTNDSVGYDLGLVGDTWTLRYKWKMTARAVNGTGWDIYTIFGLSDDSQAVNESTDQQGIGFGHYQDNLIRTFTSTYANEHNFNGEIGATNNNKNFTLVYSADDITAGTEYWISQSRLDATHVITTIYGDSNYTNAIESQVMVIPDIQNLRYLVARNRMNGNNVSGSQTIEIDDVQFWNNETVVENLPSQQTALEEEIGSFTSYTETGSGIDVSKGTNVVDFDVNNTTIRDDSVWKDLTSISDTIWRFDFDIEITSLTTNTDVSTQQLFVALSSVDGTNTVDSTADTIAFSIRMWNSSTKFTASWGNNENLVINQTNSSMTPVVSTPYYISMVRTSDTAFDIIIYSDSARTTVLETVSVTGMDASGVTSLRYLKIQEQNDDATCNGTLIGTVSNVKVWENITEVNPTTLTDYVLPVRIIGDTDLQRKTAGELEDTFTADDWTNGVGDTVFVTTGTGMIWDAGAVGSDSEYIDIDGATINDTKWRMDFDVQVDNATQGASGSNSEFYVGIGASSGSISTAQDCIYMRVLLDSGQVSTRISASTNVAIDSGAPTHSATLPSFTMGASNYYFTLQRESDVLARLTVFADKARTIELSTITVAITASTVTSLRYAHIGTKDEGGDHTFDGVVTAVRVWENTLNPVDQETATHTEDYASATGWTTDAGSLVSITGGIVTYGGAGNNTDHRISYPISMPDDKWTCDFDYRFTDSGVDAAGFYFSDIQAKMLGTVDYIGFRIDNGAGQMQISTRKSTTLTNGNVLTAFTDATWYYCRLSRNGKTIKLEAYTDSDRTILHDSDTLVITADIIGLEYMNHATPDNGATGSGQSVIDMDNVSIWKGIDSPNANGRKIVFTDNLFDTAGTEYASKTISYDPIAGDLEAEVRIPTLTMGADTTIQMYYEYGATTPSYVPEVLPTLTADAEFGLSGTEVIDDMTTYTDQTEANLGWIPNNNEAGNRVNISSDELEFNFTMDSTNETIVHDLGASIGTNNFVLRFKTNYSTLTASANNQHWFGLSDGDETESASDAQDGIGIIPIYTSGHKKFITSSPDGGTPISTNDTLGTYALTTSVDLYVTIRRTSTTTYFVEIRTGSHTGTLVEDFGGVQTCESTITGLRYIKFACHDSLSESGVQQGIIDDVEFWSNEGSVTPVRESHTYNPNYKGVYHLNGNALDSTVNANDAATENGSPTSTALSTGVGMSFDGSSDWYSAIPESDFDFENTDPVVIEFQIKTTDTSADIFTKFDLSNTGWIVGVSSGAIIGQWLNNDASNASKWIGDTAINDGELHHISLVYYGDKDTDSNRIFIDGVEDTFSNNQDNLTSSTLNAILPSIGARSNGSNPFLGTLRKLSAYKALLGTSAIQSRYNAEKANTDMITSGTEVTQ